MKLYRGPTLLSALMKSGIVDDFTEKLTPKCHLSPWHFIGMKFDICVAKISADVSAHHGAH